MTLSFDLRRIVPAAAAALVTLSLIACGGSDDGPSSGSTTATLGAAGGTLDGPGGTQLVVPAGALAQATSVAIAQSSSGAPALPPGGAEVGAVFALTPHGTSFAVPATIRVPFDASRLGAGEVPTLWKTNAAQDGWEQVPGATVSGNFVEAQISSFSWTVILTPLFPPLITVHPAPQSVVEAATATFSVGATSLINSGPLTYQWRRNGAIIGSATTGPTYTTGPTTVANDDGALYSVDVSNSVGTTSSASAMLTVTTAPVTTATLTVSVTPASSGTVTSAPAGVNCGADCTETYPLNTAVVLSATPAAGFAFSAWSPNCPGGVVTVSAGIACTATFVAVPSPSSALGRISAGGRFSLAVNAAGVPYSWGNDSASQLGNGVPDANRNTAAPFGTLTDVRSLSAGQEYHAIAVRTDGTAWAWGYRGNVDCAVGSVASTPFKVDYAIDVVAASAGYDHTLLLRNDGRVLSFGCNHSGQLGRPGLPPPMTPLAIVQGLAANIVAVAAGDGYSLALDANGDVWSWGRPDPADRSGSGSPTPARLAGLSNVIAIAAANEHALALRRDGAVFAWGSNRNGKLGDGTEVNRAQPTPTLLTGQITAIAAGSENSLALRADGVVLSWGINETGQLGNGSASPGYRPTPGPVSGLADVVAIACGFGRGHSLALRRDGSVWAWGANDAGQLGDGTNTLRLSPVVVTGLNLN